MISAYMFKHVEYCMLPSLKKHMKLSSCHFDNREQNSTPYSSHCTNGREREHVYINERDSVYACFLDFSKAF